MKRPHTFALEYYHAMSRIYLVVFLVVLSSPALCDSPPDHDYKVSTQNDVTALTTIYPPFWSVNKKFTQSTKIIAESTSESLTSSPGEYSKMKTLSSPSTSLKISTNTDSESQEYPMTKITTNLDERTTISPPETTMSSGNYDFHSQTTPSSMPETVVNACDTDQLEVTTNPVYINASTLETNCSLLVNAPNNTAISVLVLESHINNVSTYFYIELLESQIPPNSKIINLISFDNTPCVTSLQGNQFRSYFQNTEMTIQICSKEVGKSACTETVHTLIEANKCRITQYESKIQTSQSRQTFKYGFWHQSITVMVTQFPIKCTCGCPDTCMCSLGYRQWLSACTDTSQDKNTTTANLVVYKPTMTGLSFDNTGLHAIEHDAFLGLERVLVLILSNNRLLMLQPTVCYNLPQLKVLKLDNNNLVNLTSDSFTGSCSQTLLMLNLQSNKLTYISYDLFNSTLNLKYLDLRQNRLVQVSNDLFSSLAVLQILRLDDNAISTLPAGVFDPLVDLQTLDLSDNSITSLPAGVFASLGWLSTLDLSGNNISTLPVGVFATLGRLYTLDLSGNAIATLPVDVFASLGRLQTLDLSGNAIATLPVGVFATLGRLYTLDLSDNIIFILPVGVFASLGRLQTLDLSGNAVSTLPVGVFASLGQLINLDISGNTISTLHAHIFDHLNRLLILDLSNNKLRSLPGKLFLMLGKLISLNLSCNNLTINASQTFESLAQLKILDMNKNNIEQFPSKLFESPVNLISLDISENNLRMIPVTLFRNLSRLIYLNMSKNSMSRLPSFNAQGQLQVLDASENQITKLKQVTFDNLKNLKFLSIAKNFITTLHSYMLFNLDSIIFINASYNAIQMIGSKVVSDETKLKMFDLRGNEMYKVTSHSFTSFTNSTIIVDKYATCCFMIEENCISETPRTEYLTCNRLLRNVALRISVWVLGLSAFICNVIAYCIRSRKQQAKIKVQTLLISHLAMSDLLMGVNMLILAIADVYYGQYFPSYAHKWRQGFACKLAGFLSIFSSEGSVFFITLISIDRMLRIKYPFGGNRLETKSACICVTLAWLMALLIGVIPISLTSDKGNFYSISEVCIGVPIVRRHLTTFMNKSTEIKTPTASSLPVYSLSSGYFGHTYSHVIAVNVLLQELQQNITYTIAEKAGSQVGSIYAIVVFISVNLFCFVIVACCYLYIFIKARRTTEKATGSQNRNDELRMAKKMFAIVFTDFCCWVPLSFVCILTQSGVIVVSPEMYAWTVGFILPINSSINPFLYVLYDTISDHLKKRKEERKEREEIEMQIRWKPLKLFGLRFQEN